MRTLKFTIAYDGTRYAGWQAQHSTKHQAPSTKHQAVSSQQSAPRKRQKPTIQETLENALQRILQEPVRVIASGRTDAGVHAEAQVAHARVASPMPVDRLRLAVNHLLPPDIAVTAIEDAPRSFHAQYHAERKRYRYRLYTGDVVPPFIRSYVHQVRAPLNVTRMRREASALKGRHDFRAFARTTRHAGSTVRTLYDATLRRRGAELQIDFEGNGFLYTMVRGMVGTLLEVGRGRLPAGTVPKMLKTKRRDLAGATAPARGLALVRVTYPERW